MNMETIRGAMAACLRVQDKLLLCCAEAYARSIGDAAREAGAVPVAWEPNLRWQNLIRLALLHRATAAAGSWRVILGLSKLAKATAAPLRIRNVILTGEGCPDWAAVSISAGLDAKVWDCTCFPPDAKEDASLQQLEQTLLTWSSVLDYRAARTEMGLSLELIVFPGKQLPQLPSGARVTVRHWIPGKDVPFLLEKY